MCRDWHLAEDLTQATLAKIYVSWPRISRVGNLEQQSLRSLQLLRDLLGDARADLFVDEPA